MKKIKCWKGNTVAVQSFSRVWLCNPMDCSTPGFPALHHLPELAQTHVHRLGDAIQLSHPLSPPLLLPSIFPRIRGFSNELVLPIRWPKYWSFSFNISLSNEYSGLISFEMDWFDLLAVQGPLKSLLRHHSSKASLLRRSAFFTVQLSHPYMTSGKTILIKVQIDIHIKHDYVISYVKVGQFFSDNNLLVKNTHTG